MEDKKKSVLVVEDEQPLLEAIKLKLGKQGIEVLPAVNGEEALAILAQQKPNLVWLDVLLPGINGLEVLKKIRENIETRNLPVVIVSVSASPEKVEQAFNLNVLDYIVKSEFTIEKIVDKVLSLIH